MKHLGCPFENIAYMSARFEDDLIAHFHLNWLAPVKVRRMLVGGSKKMIVYDDMETSEKVKVYDKGISMNHDPQDRQRLLIGYRNGDMVAPNLDISEALRLMASDFVRAIVEKRPPISDGYAGYRVVRLLELAQRSMAKNGRPIELRSPVSSSFGGITFSPTEPPKNGGRLTVPFVDLPELTKPIKKELSDVPLAFQV
jgi:predicted dehydrogenase